VQQEDIEFTANGFGCVIINAQNKHCTTLTLNSDNTGELITGKSATEIREAITYTLDESNNLLTICKSENDCSDYTFVEDEIRIRETEDLGGADSCIISIILKK